MPKPAYARTPWEQSTAASAQALPEPGRQPVYVTQPALPELEAFLPYLQEIWGSRMLTNGGTMHQRLEAALCAYLGVEHLSLFCNGTQALITALQAAGLSGEVITTPYSFVATAHSLLWNNLTPVFVDIDPRTLNLDPTRIEAAITEKTTAILPVHCYGHPCDVAAIRAIAERHGLKVIYDAAHAFGAQDTGGSLLRHGDMATLSFHATKVFSTFEGGAIVCRDEATKRRIDQLKNFGLSADGTTVEVTGTNGKLSEIHAAFGLLQLQGVDEALEKRRRIDQRYRAGLAGIAGIHCICGVGEAVANHAYFPILVGPEFGLSRDALFAHLAAHNIHGRRYFQPLISGLPMYRGYPSASAGNLPVAHQVVEQVICLPIYPDLDHATVDFIIGLIAGAAA
ncbi:MULTISPECIES: DegT/DnrJ/EryC1/StrS family aminotransferase [unclassified Pseudomonas]|uniref:DegT/DnrJ/EryC1/StrS family aminotransferase n=1 Tax=unclassified Pseudomonas TaxID=196821 RepID=UPI0009DD0600|nr:MULTISPECIES: DegT/DnrJ/EryC1/StrS family aminotransferase [unclassified Pseudomonas]RAS31632.1 dTDP-4-amino-4,6-dideoxygalactose transaminase [Pseudomonas sp. URMO17WK12:I7]SMF08133.1 dTDP-4-amino-4,6-dideoxygalactose transaminase [Pseudomonas sp. URMO17WK12:I5]